MKVVGVDGCRSGWVAAALDTTKANDTLAVTVYPDFKSLLASHADAAQIWIDIPIGLPFGGVPRRACDVQARRLLGARASSVFSPPCRAAVYAPDYTAARALNRSELGCSFSIQAWGICRKIAEVDQCFAADDALMQRVHEAHPELSFARLNRSQALVHNKKTAAGAAERRALLAAHHPLAIDCADQAMANTARKDVQADDILDALVLAIRASANLREQSPPLAAGSQRDACNLPMEIYY